ncbi:MAG: hypothetical protein CFE34_12135 [Rhodobacteraceae bacterium PARR1]|nr:MAG: hypothetical protein CFE34_12135 [Rhodobacteraceae bacterium PARR1]
MMMDQPPPDGPTDGPPDGNDPALMARVLTALEGMALASVSVEFIEGTLVLRGAAGSAEVRDQATQTARAVANGAPVENRMRVG